MKEKGLPETVASIALEKIESSQTEVSTLQDIRRHASRNDSHIITQWKRSRFVIVTDISISVILLKFSANL